MNGKNWSGFIFAQAGTGRADAAPPPAFATMRRTLQVCGSRGLLMYTATCRTALRSSVPTPPTGARLSRLSPGFGNGAQTRYGMAHTRTGLSCGTIGQLLSTNDAVYADLKASLANIRKVTADLKDGQGLAGRLVYDEKLGEDASQLLANLKSVSARLEKGSGTLGKLMTDQELYNELNALIKDVRQIVDNYRDTTPVSTFGSLIMGGL